MRYNMFAICTLFQCRKMRSDSLHEQLSLVIIHHINDLLDDIIGELIFHHDHQRTVSVRGCISSLSPL